MKNELLTIADIPNVMLCRYARFAKKMAYSSKLILSLTLASAYCTYKELKLFDSIMIKQPFVLNK